MLKSGKLKLADDMIVTAQEAANKAETVFTIYDDTTNTEIASGPIGGGGGDLGLKKIKLTVKLVNPEDAATLATLSFNSAVLNIQQVNIGKMLSYDAQHLQNQPIGEGLYLLEYQLSNNQEIELLAPVDGGVYCGVPSAYNSTIDSESDTADVAPDNKDIYFTGDGEVLVTFGEIN